MPKEVRIDDSGTARHQGNRSSNAGRRFEKALVITDRACSSPVRLPGPAEHPGFPEDSHGDHLRTGRQLQDCLRTKRDETVSNRAASSDHEPSRPSERRSAPGAIRSQHSTQTAYRRPQEAMFWHTDFCFDAVQKISNFERPGTLRTGRNARMSRRNSLGGPRRHRLVRNQRMPSARATVIPSPRAHPETNTMAALKKRNAMNEWIAIPIQRDRQ
jgi:hypothetical protein